MFERARRKQIVNNLGSQNVVGFCFNIKLFFFFVSHRSRVKQSRAEQSKCDTYTTEQEILKCDRQNGRHKVIAIRMCKKKATTQQHTHICI